MYALDPIRGWAQTFSGGLEKTQPDNEGSGKKRGIEVVRYINDLSHPRQFVGKPSTGCSKKGKDHRQRITHCFLLEQLRGGESA